MNHQELLADLLRRFQLGGESVLYIGYAEAQTRPSGFKQALETSGLLVPAPPAKSLVCDGCEEQCLMPVSTVPGGRPRAYIVCETRDDVSRIPVVLESLTRWKLTSSGLIKLLSESLGGRQGQASLAEGALPRLALSDLITIVNDEMRIDSESLFSTLQPAETLEKPNCFKRTGDGWSITYLNKTQFFADSLGLKCIAYLIARQGNDVRAYQLNQHISSGDTLEINQEYSELSGMALEELGLQVSDLGDAGESISPKVLLEMQAQMKKLEKGLELAEETGNETQAAQHRDELGQIAGYISPQLDHKGRPRKISDNQKRMVDRVSSNIRNALKKTEASWPELAGHLDCIQLGATCKYAPTPPVEWGVDDSAHR